MDLTGLQKMGLFALQGVFMFWKENQSYAMVSVVTFECDFFAELLWQRACEIKYIVNLYNIRPVQIVAICSIIIGYWDLGLSI